MPGREGLRVVVVAVWRIRRRIVEVDVEKQRTFAFGIALLKFLPDLAIRWTDIIRDDVAENLVDVQNLSQLESVPVVK